MVGILELWLPILLSAVIVFVVSSIIHMASPWHKNDYPRMPNEDQVRNALPQAHRISPSSVSSESLRSLDTRLPSGRCRSGTVAPGASLR